MTGHAGPDRVFLRLLLPSTPLLQRLDPTDHLYTLANLADAHLLELGLVEVEYDVPRDIVFREQVGQMAQPEVGQPCPDLGVGPGAEEVAERYPVRWLRSGVRGCLPSPTCFSTVFLREVLALRAHLAIERWQSGRPCIHAVGRPGRRMERERRRGRRSRVDRRRRSCQMSRRGHCRHGEVQLPARLLPPSLTCSHPVLEAPSSRAESMMRRS